MTKAPAQDRGRPSREAKAEAAAWLIKLQAAGRDRSVEDGLREWLRASKEHAAAFESATDLWDRLGGAPVASLYRQRERPAHVRFPAWKWAAAGATCMALVVGLFALIAEMPGSDLSTRIGEQRAVTLKDGSRVTLNTDSRIVVQSWSDVREIQLQQGEAFFEVARNPDKPFVVVAGNKKVIALGTSFVVRRLLEPTGERVVVTLVEGKVAVSDREVAPRAILDSTAAAPILKAGQRMVIAQSVASVSDMDAQKIGVITAWRRGEIVLDNTSLADAAVEFNRYSETTLVLGDGSAAQLLVSGVFRTGDSESFATAMRGLYDLQIARESNKLILSKASAKP